MLKFVQIKLDVDKTNLKIKLESFIWMIFFLKIWDIFNFPHFYAIYIL
jgi:hypothetical protein